jgi:hypothetical protein
VVLGIVCLIAFGVIAGCVTSGAFRRYKEGEQARVDSLRAYMESLYVHLYDTTVAKDTSWYEWLTKLANAVCNIEETVPNVPVNKRICPNNKGGGGDQTTPPPPPPKP